MDEELMTAQELARYLKVDLRTVYRYLKDTKLPAIRMEGRWRFRREEVDRWLLHDLPAKARQALPLRVMVVEDDEHFRSFLTTVLRETPGYIVQEAKSGEEALALCRDMGFDLLIVDLRMPKMDGITLIHHVRRLHPSTRFIIVTGFGDKKSAIDAVHLGVSEYLEKPIRDLQLFRTTVERALRP